jgi:hypothetical protein
LDHAGHQRCSAIQGESQARTARSARGQDGAGGGAAACAPPLSELRIDNRLGQVRPVMLELAARCIGGLCSRALRFGGGQNLEELVLASALGQRVSPRRLPGTSGVLMLPIERPGVLQAVHGRAEAAAVPGITGLNITIPIGQPVQPLPEGDRYLGFVFAEGRGHQQVVRALGTACERLHVVIQ